MQKNKLFSVAIALLLIAFFTTSWVSAKHNSPPKEIAISTAFTSGAFPNLEGPFSTTGALQISGTVTMNVSVIGNGERLHCLLVFTTTDGTFTVQMACSPPNGRWEIVSGTGAYANLRGTGKTFMDSGESMTGVIY